MKNRTLIFTATYNESENIENFLNKIESLNLNADILIVDDNSPDNTWKIIENFNKKKIILIKREKKLGLDSAHRIAYNYATENSYGFLITLDADLSHDPNLIPKFIDYLETHPFVIGSRYMLGGNCEMRGYRKYLSLFGNKFIKFISKSNCDEFTTSFRGFNLSKLNGFHLNQVSSKGYSFMMETIFILNSKKIPIKQIPINFKIRKKGESKIPKIEIFRTLINLFKLKFNL